MDPNLRETIRAWVGSADVLEAIGEDGQAALMAMLEPPPLAPHLVTVKEAKVKIDAQGDRSHAGVAACPDCGRGLTSRGYDLICPRLPTSTTIAGELDKGRIVACGEGLTDG